MKRRKSSHPGTKSRRKAIIQAALECFSEIGFTETSMEDIRRRSHASTGSIYHHFKSKEQLAVEVYLEGIQEYQDGLITALESQKGAKRGIHALIEHHLKWVEGNVEWSRYLFQKRYSLSMTAMEEQMSAMNREFLQRASEWFASQLRTGTLRPMPPDIYISILLGPCMEFTRQYLSGLARTSLEKAVEYLVEAAWLSVAAKPFTGENEL
jgi:AcrR family transcriptional regulator